MRRLRIAIIADRRHPIAEPFAGGLEAHVWHLATALRGRGHDVTLFSGPGSDPGISAHSLEPATLELSAAALADPSMPEEAWMRDHHAYLELMLRLAGPLGRSFDVVHNHSLHYLPIAMASTLPTPMVTTLHTPPTPWLESAVRAGPAGRNRFVAVSRHTARTWAPIVPAVSVVANGVDCARWPVGPGGGDLIWFGRLTPEKAPHLAVQAARMAGLRLRIAGPLHDRTYFSRQVRPLLGADVVYLGHLHQATLAKEVGRAAAAMVTPTWDEPYGLVVPESLACGTPVAAFDRGGIPEILTPECGEVVARDDVDGLASATRRVMGLSRTASARRAREHCAMDRMVDEYVATYEESFALIA